jgi:hypothetical protein
MTRAWRVVLFGLATVAASPAPDFPIPPVPPRRPPTGESAPTPNDSVRPPVVVADEDPKFELRVFRARQYEWSQGFLPGSRYETTEDRKPIQTPGLTVTVPLQ